MYHYFIHIYGQIIPYYMIIITFSLSIHQLVDIYVVPTFCLLWIMLLWTFVCMFSVPQGIYLVVELLGHITLCLTYCCCSCSVAQSSLTLCDPLDCSTPGSSVLLYLPEFTQIHVPVMLCKHLILCHPLLPLIFPSIRVFSNESALHVRHTLKPVNF